jgi:hypothetical protein
VSERVEGCLIAVSAIISAIGAATGAMSSYVLQEYAALAAAAGTALVIGGSTIMTIWYKFINTHKDQLTNTTNPKKPNNTTTTTVIVVEIKVLK